MTQQLLKETKDGHVYTADDPTDFIGWEAVTMAKKLNDTTASVRVKRTRLNGELVERVIICPIKILPYEVIYIDWKKKRE